MRVYCTKDYQDMSRKAANIISAEIIMKPDCILGLATGSTPIGVYKQLIEWYQKGDLDFSKVRTVNLDEYKGLSEDNVQSYRYFMNHNLFHHINIDLKNTYIPNGMAEDDAAECARYTGIIKALGSVDLQLLGVGHNGHIGFNEPSSSFELDTKCVALTKSTIDANSRLFDNVDEVPRYAYTMGIKNIMDAKTILIVASGEDKADIIKRAFNGEVTPEVPVSILQMHKDVILVGDEAALSKL